MLYSLVQAFFQDVKFELGGYMEATVFVFACLFCLMAGVVIEPQRLSRAFGVVLVFATIAVIVAINWGLATMQMNFALQASWTLTNSFGLDRRMAVVIICFPMGSFYFARAVIPRQGSLNTMWP